MCLQDVFLCVPNPFFAKTLFLISICFPLLGRRSEPSFYHPQCAYANTSNPSNGLKYTESDIQDILDIQKQVVEVCWSCKECGFFFSGIKKEDSTIVPLHFLEYAGTRQLVEDLFRFKNLVKAEKLSLYGISYGTNVMATFATVFPDYVDKFVIDSNMYVYVIMSS